MPEYFSFNKYKYVTEKGDVELECEWPLEATLKTLIDLTRQGINPYDVTWFYYDHDWSQDADECHLFFVVHRRKIIAESCSFSSEEPMILRKADDDSVWHNHEYFDLAWEQYWYCTFYTESMAGRPWYCGRMSQRCTSTTDRSRETR